MNPISLRQEPHGPATPSIVFAMRYPDDVGYVWNSIAAVRDAVAAQLEPEWRCWLAYPQLTGRPAYRPQQLTPVALDLYSNTEESLQGLQRFVQTQAVQAVVYMSALPSSLNLRRIHGMGIRTLNTENDSFDHDRRDPLWLWLLKTIERRVLHRGLHHLHIANAHSQAQWLERYARIPSSRLVVVCNGVDVQHFQPANTPQAQEQAARASGMHVDHLWVLCAGQSRPEKRIPAIVQMARRLLDSHPVTAQPVSFAYVGDGPADAEIRQAVSDAGLQDRFLLAGHHDDLLPFYQRAAVFVHAAERESFGLVLAEAMSCGVPLVACTASGPQELIVEGYNGHLVPRHDPQALMEPTSRLLLDAERRAQLGAQGRMRALSCYDRRAQAASMAAAIRGAISGA